MNCVLKAHKQEVSRLDSCETFILTRRRVSVAFFETCHIWKSELVSTKECQGARSERSKTPLFLLWVWLSASSIYREIRTGNVFVFSASDWNRETLKICKKFFFPEGSNQRTEQLKEKNSKPTKNCFKWAFPCHPSSIHSAATAEHGITFFKSPRTTSAFRHWNHPQPQHIWKAQDSHSFLLLTRQFLTSDKLRPVCEVEMNSNQVWIDWIGHKLS